MDTELMLDVGQANELKLAFRRNGWTNADVKKFSEGDLAAKLLSVIRGFADVVVVKHIIDCDAEPFLPEILPERWEVESHKKGGSLEWNPTKVRLHLSPSQQGGKCIKGNRLRKELENEPVLNANVLDFLIKHPELIPEEWKDKCVFFWGTIYRNSGGLLYVRFLDWDGGRWYWSYGCLGGDWSGIYPAVCSQVSS